MTSDQFRKRALSLPEAVESPHFEKTSFRVRGKIFATLAPERDEAVLKLSPLEQAVFCDNGAGAVFPVANKWGNQGWTVVALRKASASLVRDALVAAYRNVAPPSLRDQPPGGRG